jgi:hypothetical protein
LRQCLSSQASGSSTHHIDEHLQRPFPLLDKLGRIVLLPLLLLVLAKVPLECLLSPRALDRVRDRSECGDGLVLARVLEELRRVSLVFALLSADTHQGKGSVATHAVARDADSAPVQLLELLEECFRKFLCDVRVHVVSLRPGLLCRIYVEASARAEVVCVVLALDLQATCMAFRVSQGDQCEASDVRGLVSGYTTAMPFSLAPCWKKPFSEQLSPVHVRPDR